MRYPRIGKHVERTLPIEYEIELYGAMKRVTLPLVVGVIADLSGQSDEERCPLGDRKMTLFDRDNFDDRMKAVKPRVAFRLVDPTGRDDTPRPIEITFESIDDFGPEAIARRVEFLSAMLDERTTLAELRDLFHAKPRLADDAFSTLRRGETWPPPWLEGEPEPATPELPTSLRQLEVLSLGAHFGMHVLSKRFEVAACASSGELMTATAQAVASLDHQLGHWMNAILHHPRIQRLEAAWHGIALLVRRGFDGESAKCRVLNASVTELLADFRHAPRYDHSSLHKLLADELRTLGGEPFAMVVIDHDFGFDPRDVELLGELARVGLALDLVFAAGVSPAMFQMDSFVELPIPRDLTKIFSLVEYTQWRYLRSMEASRHLALVLPRILGREAHRLDDADGHRLNFVESVDRRSDQLWINSAFALVDCVRAAFVRHGWFGALRGVEGGGLVDGLPCRPSFAPDRDLELYCPTEVPISGRREAELVRCGFVPLLHCRGTDYAAFFSTPSVCKPEAYDDRDIEALDAASCDLRSVLSLGLIRRYMIVMSAVFEGQGKDVLRAKLIEFLRGLTSVNPVNPADPPLLQQAYVDLDGDLDDGNGLTIYSYLRLGFQFEELQMSYSSSMRLQAVLGPG